MWHFAPVFVALEKCSETKKIIRNMYLCGSLDLIYKFLVAHETKKLRTPGIYFMHNEEKGVEN